jgi:ribosomal 30S subunit maturation factor RimM
LLNEIVKANQEFKKKKLQKHEIERTRKSSFELVSALNEFIHRREMLTAEKYQIKIIYKTNNELKEGKLFIFDDFAIAILSDSDVAKKIDLKSNQISDMLVSDFNAKNYARTSPKLKISPELYNALGKLFGKFELVF